MLHINQCFSGVSNNNQFKPNPFLGPYAKKRDIWVLMTDDTAILRGEKSQANKQTRAGLYSGIPAI